MDTLIEERIAELHRAPTKAYIVTTGGGAGLQSLLTQVAGASGTLIESLFPYGKEAMMAFLGYDPEKYVSLDTALKMAARAWRNGVELDVRGGGNGKAVVGLALTAAIATNRIMKGDHRVYIALRTYDAFYTASVTFKKKSDGWSLLGRAGEGEICDLLALDMLLFAAGIEQIPVAGEALESAELADTAGGRILAPAKRVSKAIPEGADGLVIYPDGTHGQAGDLSSDEHVILCGSFDPLHHGHESIARRIELSTRKSIVYALTTDHPAKGIIPLPDIERRATQFGWIAPVLLTRHLGLYVDKARRFQGFSFVIGADVLRGILDERYYTLPVESVLQEFVRCGTKFFVASRAENGTVLTVRDVFRDAQIDRRFDELFVPVDVDVDISSSLVRGR